MAGKLANAADENGFAMLAKQFNSMRDELEGDAEVLEESLHVRPRDAILTHSVCFCEYILFLESHKKANLFWKSGGQWAYD